MHSSLFPLGFGEKRGRRKHRPMCTWTVRVWVPVSGSCPRNPAFTLMCSGLFLFVFFFLYFGWSQSRHSHVDHRDPPVRLGTMDDEGRGFAKSAQLHPPFFRLLSKSIIDELPKGSLFCLPIFSFQSALFCCVLFMFCLIEGVESASGLKTRSSVRSTTVVRLSFLITSPSS